MARRGLRARSTLVLAIALPGCMSWQLAVAIPGPGVEAVITQEQPNLVRTTGADGTELTIDDPTIRGDSIVGRRGRDPVAVATGDVSRLEVGRASVGRTLALFGGIVLLGGSLAYFGIGWVGASNVN